MNRCTWPTSYRRALMTLGVVSLLSLTQCKTVNHPTAPDWAVQAAATELTYKGKPLHPKLIELFHGSLADNAPPVVRTVDINASRAASNEYFTDDIEEDDGRIYYERKGEGSFGYRHLGRMSPDTCAVAMYEDGGGNTVFVDILVLRFRMDPQSGHLLADVMAREPLGRRDLSRAKCLEGRIVLPPVEGLEKSPPVLTIYSDGTVR